MECSAGAAGGCASSRRCGSRGGSGDARSTHHHPPADFDRAAGCVRGSQRDGLRRGGTGDPSVCLAVAALLRRTVDARRRGDPRVPRAEPRHPSPTPGCAADPGWPRLARRGDGQAPDHRAHPGRGVGSEPDRVRDPRPCMARRDRPGGGSGVRNPHDHPRRHASGAVDPLQHAGAIGAGPRSSARGRSTQTRADPPRRRTDPAVAASAVGVGRRGGRSTTGSKTARRSSMRSTTRPRRCPPPMAD